MTRMTLWSAGSLEHGLGKRLRLDEEEEHSGTRVLNLRMKDAPGGRGVRSKNNRVPSASSAQPPSQ